jgi:hypothetical protein
MGWKEAGRDINMAEYRGWTDPERIVANVFALYRQWGHRSRRRTGPTCSGKWAAMPANWLGTKGVAMTIDAPLNATHDPAARSWLASANLPETDFPIQNLPFWAVRTRRPGAGRGGAWRLRDRSGGAG